jgi:hypothetical protein
LNCHMRRRAPRNIVDNYNKVQQTL